jgi:hypothetical protein
MFPMNAVRLYAIVALGCGLLVPELSWAKEPQSEEQVSANLGDLRTTLLLYQRLTGRKLWIEPRAAPYMELSINFEGPKDESIKVIRKALLEKGITLRDAETETFVTYAPPKKFPQGVTSVPKTPEETPDRSKDSLKQREATASGKDRPAEPLKVQEVKLHITELRSALDFCERVQRKLWLSLDVPDGPFEVSIEFEGSRDGGIKAVHKGLREKGFAVRDTETETFITYTPLEKSLGDGH